MTKAIWKFPIPVKDQFTLIMPEGAVALHVAMQNVAPHLWALVEVGAPMKPREFRVFGTGHLIGDAVGRYVGTFQMNGGALVFHLFEEKTP